MAKMTEINVAGSWDDEVGKLGNEDQKRALMRLAEEGYNEDPTLLKIIEGSRIVNPSLTDILSLSLYAFREIKDPATDNSQAAQYLEKGDYLSLYSLAEERRNEAYSKLGKPDFVPTGSARYSTSEYRKALFPKVNIAE